MANRRDDKHEYLPSTNTDGCTDGRTRRWDCYATKDRATGQVFGVAWESMPKESGWISFDLFGCRKVKTDNGFGSRMTDKAERAAIDAVKAKLIALQYATDPSATQEPAREGEAA